jgi:uncharacterized protein YbaP (TraB family)
MLSTNAAVGYGRAMRLAAGVGAVLAGAGLALAVSAADLAERGPVTRHTLWKIEGGRSTVHLLGSIHVLRRQNYPLERPIEDAFDEARVVAFEVDLDQARVAVAHEAAAGAEAKRSLRTDVSPATYRSVVRYLEDAGYPPTVFDRLPPPFVAAALVQMQLRQLGFEPEWGVDAYFHRRARKYGKTIIGLETVEEQRQAMGGMGERGADELVQAALEDVATLRTTLRDLIRAWKGGELDRLQAIVNGSFAARPEVYRRVLVERNVRWVPKIEALMAGDEPALVIVGTGHLVGEDSVVAMLEAKGHLVRQQ